MKVYIAGVVSLGGRLTVEQQQINAKRFYDAESVLRELGYEPVNPLRLNPVGEATNWAAVMKVDLKALLDCDGVYALKGWDAGLGSVIEVELARALSMTIIEEG
jgi:hypothetical protein